MILEQGSHIKNLVPIFIASLVADHVERKAGSGLKEHCEVYQQKEVYVFLVNAEKKSRVACSSKKSSGGLHGRQPEHPVDPSRPFQTSNQTESVGLELRDASRSEETRLSALCNSGDTRITICIDAEDLEPFCAIYGLRVQSHYSVHISKQLVSEFDFI